MRCPLVFVTHCIVQIQPPNRKGYFLRKTLHRVTGGIIKPDTHLPLITPPEIIVQAQSPLHFENTFAAALIQHRTGKKIDNMILIHPQQINTAHNPAMPPHILIFNIIGVRPFDYHHSKGIWARTT